jgi:hypothetical protein
MLNIKMLKIFSTFLANHISAMPVIEFVIFGAGRRQRGLPEAKGRGRTLGVNYTAI